VLLWWSWHQIGRHGRNRAAGEWKLGVGKAQSSGRGVPGREVSRVSPSRLLSFFLAVRESNEGQAGTWGQAGRGGVPCACSLPKDRAKVGVLGTAWGGTAQSTTMSFKWCTCGVVREGSSVAWVASLQPPSHACVGSRWGVGLPCSAVEGGAAG